MRIAHSLTASTRQDLYEAFGLASLTFLYAETQKGSVLRARVVEGAGSRAVLAHAKVEDLASAPATMTLEYQDLCRSFASNTPTFWEQIFPSPLHLFSRLSLSPPAFKEEWQRIREALTQLEGKLSETEVSLLYLQGIKSFPLFTHFVRGRCVRVGTSAELARLGVTFTEGNLTTDDLRRAFGTQASFLSLTLASPGVESLCEAVRDLVRRPADVRFRIAMGTGLGL